MTNPIKTAGVLVLEGEKVLLVSHGKASGHLEGIYGIPAGRLELGETEIERAVKELYEESGLSTRPEDLLELPKVYVKEIERKDGKKLYSLKVYLCRAYTGTLRGTEETVPKWVRISDLGKYSLLPNVEDIVKEGLKILKQ